MPKIVGGPKTIVDELERWSELADVDGFNLAHATNPGSFEDLIDFVLPELRRRGLFPAKGDVKEGLTARELVFGQADLLDDHYGAKFRWRAGEKGPKYLEESEVDDRPAKKRKIATGESK